MNDAQAMRIADAVMYEGYALYPYGADALKNQRRWTFGAVLPSAYVTAFDSGDRDHVQAQVLLVAPPSARIAIWLRCLHATDRVVERAVMPEGGGREPTFQTVDRLAIGGRTIVPWRETEERSLAVAPAALASLLDDPRELSVRFDGDMGVEDVAGPGGETLGRVTRRRAALSGTLRLAAERVAGTDADVPIVVKLTVRVENHSALPRSGPLGDAAPTPGMRREAALLGAMLSTHLLLAVDAGGFVSSIDPPEALSALAASCACEGCWPVLVGAPGQQGWMLCAPFILEDHPEIAPESPGDLFDGTEIDEILSLRIMTMTADEKAAARATDPRVRALLERTEHLPPEHLARLHGAMRGGGPARGGGVR